MRNTWKGLVVGGLTGVAGGAILDLIGRASHEARRAGELAKSHVADVTSWMRHASERADEPPSDADVPGHVRDASKLVS